MKALAQALVERFASASAATLRAKIEGYGGDSKLRFAPAPIGTNFPYVTFTCLFIDQEMVGNSGYHEIYNIQFSIFDDTDSPLRVMEIRKDLLPVYDDAILTLQDSREMIYAHRGGGSPNRLPDKGYVYHQEYAYRIC